MNRQGKQHGIEVMSNIELIPHNDTFGLTGLR